MNRIILFILVLFALFCSACHEKNERIKKLETELHQFKEKAITFPNNLQANIFDEKMLPDTTLLRRPLKMVVYVNQSGCEDCKLRALLPIYMFILENEHLMNFAVIIILHTANKDTPDYMLKEMRFRRTVFYDLDGSFERLNPHLPNDEQFHTFLLNKENKVVLAGNPVYNERLKKLYLKELIK